MPRRPALLLLAPALVAALLLPAPAAHAVDCDGVGLIGGGGFDHRFTNLAEAEISGANAFTATGRPFYQRDLGSLAFDAPNDACQLEDGGRELVWPAQDVGGATVQPKAYVPSGPPAFLRRLYVLRNPTGAQATIRLARRLVVPDANGDVTQSSTGDQAATPADAWMTFRSALDASAPTVAAVWQGASPLRRLSASDVFVPGSVENAVTDGSDRQNVRWQTVALQPGETAVIADFLAVRGGLNAQRDAEAIARLLADGANAAWAGMSEDELTGVRNFVVPDADRDGVPNETDNCLYVANPGQANADGDAEGDACDADDDNDGLPDALEAEFRTNPLVADTDGDGVADRADPCPTVAGSAGGCPESAGIVGRVRAGALTARLRPQRDTRAPFRFRVTGSVLPPPGLSIERTCRSRGWVTIRFTHGRRRLANRRTRINRNCAFSHRVTFRNRKRIGRRTTALRVRVRWQGNRYLSPRNIGTYSAYVR